MPWGVFLVLVAYTYAWFYETPYLGFYFAGSSGKITKVFTEDPPMGVLTVGDTITHIDGQSLHDRNQQLFSPYFGHYSDGDLIPMTITKSNGETIHLQWEYLGFTRIELFERINSAWWISWIFFLTGTIAYLSIRPRDRKWRLFVAFNYLTGVWLMMGNGLSTYNTWLSGLLLHVCVWISLPLYLQLSWVFPEPFFKATNRQIWVSEIVITGIAIELAVADIYDALPTRSYINAFLITLVISLVLMLFHLFLQKSARPSILLLFRFGLLSFLPMIIVAMLSIFMDIPALSLGASTVFLILMPFGFYYAIFRHRLGNLEFRTNRALSLVIFTFLIISLFSLILGFLQVRLGFGELFFLVSIASIMVATTTALIFFPYFQKFIERYILRIPYISSDLVSVFSEQITTAPSIERLVDIILEQILPYLLIRQSTLISLTAKSRYGPGLYREVGSYRPTEV